MKKLLMSFVIVFVMQGSSLQGICNPLCMLECLLCSIRGTGQEYEWLNTLPQDSKIRNMSLGLRRAFMCKGETEILFDQLEEKYRTITVRERNFLLKEFEDKDIKKKN